MKTTLHFSALFVSAVLMLVSCEKDSSSSTSGGSSGSETSTVEVTSVTLSKTSLSLAVGGSETLTATVLPSNATDASVTWTTSSASVATVSDGLVTAVAAGSATITATAGSKSATCTVTVSESSSGSDGTLDTYSQSTGTTSYSSYTITNSTSDANSVLVTGGTLTLEDCTITKTGDTSTSQGSDDTSFYGINSAVKAGTGSTSASSATAVINMTGGTVTTNAKGANAFFAYGADSKLVISDVTVNCTARASRGLIATYGGTIEASNLTITTNEETSSVIATDRGGGTVTVDGGTYVCKGNKCAIIYSAGTMSVSNASGSSALGEICDIEGDNSVTITNCDFSCSSSSRGLLMMQSGSGDATGVNPVMTITGSTLTLTDSSAPLLEVATCVNATLTLDNCTLTVPSGILMAVMEDSQWSTSGAVGNLILSNGTYTGKVTQDSGYTANVTVNSGATWNLTANTTITTLVNNGTINKNGYTLTYSSLSGSGTIQ